MSDVRSLAMTSYIPKASDIYHGPWASYIGNKEGRHPVLGNDARAMLWKGGQRAMVLASFTHCQSGTDRAGCDFEVRLNHMVRAAQLFEAAGWTQDSFYVYIIDEVNAHAVQTYARNITLAIKARLPRAHIVACGDGAWAVATTPGMVDRGGALEFVDVFIPRMGTLMNTSQASIDRVKASRNGGGGKRVGWYTSGNFPDGPYALGKFLKF